MIKMSEEIPLNLRVIKVLLDDNGHANWEINKCLGRKTEEKGNLQKVLKPLYDGKCIYRDSSRNTTNRDSGHPTQQEIPYYIAKSDEAFRYITKMVEGLEKQSRESYWEQVLNSNYTNNLINELGFGEVYSLVEVLLKDTDFNRMASRTLLKRPALAEEYIDKFQKYYEYLSKPENDFELWKLGVLPKPKFRENHRFQQEIDLSMNKKHIEILGQFYPLEAVHIYRATIYKEIQKLFLDLYNTSFITKGLNLFIQYDNYLTPFTSFPINRIQNIYSRSFGRIYEDAYVFDTEDLSKLRQRAFVIYKYFADLLFEYFKNNIANEEIRSVRTKEFIYHWNVSRDNFDLTFEYMSAVYERRLGSGKYHIYNDKSNLIIYDLGSYKEIPLESIIESEDDIPLTVGGYSDTIRYGLVTPHYDPYKELKPCDCFKGMTGESYPEKITFSEILKDVQSRLDVRLV